MAELHGDVVQIGFPLSPGSSRDHSAKAWRSATPQTVKKPAQPKIEGICNACGSELVTRPDDVPETVRSRLAVYHKETEALKGFYEKLGKLRLIEGNQPIEDATRDILAALGVSK